MRSRSLSTNFVPNKIIIPMKIYTIIPVLLTLALPVPVYSQATFTNEDCNELKQVYSTLEKRYENSVEKYKIKQSLLTDFRRINQELNSMSVRNNLSIMASRVTQACDLLLGYLPYGTAGQVAIKAASSENGSDFTEKALYEFVEEVVINKIGGLSQVKKIVGDAKNLKNSVSALKYGAGAYSDASKVVETDKVIKDQMNSLSNQMATLNSSINQLKYQKTELLNQKNRMTNFLQRHCR
jgi:hypothetical protein